jgi:hypothetical protein
MNTLLDIAESRILRNSGFPPPEIELRREIATVGALLGLTAAGERGPALRRLDQAPISS